MSSTRRRGLLSRRLLGVPFTVAATLLAALAVAGGGTAYALTSAASVTVPSPGAYTVYECVGKVGTQARMADHIYTTARGFAGAGPCPSGQFAIAFNSTGPKGAAGATGAQGPAGPAGPQGPAGPGGASSVTSVTAATTVTNWPESSGWATDNFTRTLDVTVQGQVNNSHCGGAPVCYSVFGTITDNGTTTTVDGHASPNGSSKDLIKGAWTGTMQGAGDFEFYATSNKIDAKNVPVSADGSAKPASTTAWGELAFPAGTQFFGVTLTAYSWVYVVPVTCGTNSNVTETWSDSINPGDDGQGAADGNIVGAAQVTGGCPAS